MDAQVKPTARKLILGLLLAAEGHPLSAQAAVSACALFNITDNNVRVALARLVAEGLLESPDRGNYLLGPAARSVAEQVATWHAAEQQLVPWHGGYIVAWTGALGRSDRKALSVRHRAAEFLGLREVERGLYLRPDNLRGGVEAVRKRLLGLGVEPAVRVFSAAEFDQEMSARIPALWDIASIESRYRSERQELEDWLAGYTKLGPEAAARESYLLGGRAIRSLVYDPWLPAEMIDTTARHAYVETVQRFDATGKQIWNALATSDFGMPIAPAATHLNSPLNNPVLP